MTIRRPGFTYIEMACVLLILVALTAVVVPMAHSYLSDAQYTTTKATMSQLRNAVLQYYQDMKGIQLPRPAEGTQGTAYATTSDSTGIPQYLKELQFLPTDANGNTITVDVNGNSILFNPVTQRGWRGPYLQQATGTFQPQSSSPSPGLTLDSTFYPNGATTVAGTYSYGSVGDTAFLDGWGNPIILQWPTAGSSGQSTSSQDLAQRVLYVRLVSAGALSKNSSGHTASVIDTVTNQLMPIRSQRGNDIVLFILTQDQYPWMP